MPGCDIFNGKCSKNENHGLHKTCVRQKPIKINLYVEFYVSEYADMYVKDCPHVLTVINFLA